MNGAQEEKYITMTRSPVEGLVLRLSVPTIVTMLISSLYNMADTYFVGTIGTAATAGVGVVFSLMALIQAVGFFFGHGSGNYIARELGAHNIDNASQMAATGFFTAMLVGVAIGGGGLVFIEPLARLLGATDSILTHTCQYLRFILIGTPWMTCSLMLNNLLRYQGSAFYGMLGMVSGAVLNIALDPLFIFVLDLGVSGASLATMLSQMVGLCILLKGCTKSGNIRISPRNFTPCTAYYREMVRGGSPSFSRQGLASIATVCLNQLAGGFGDAAIAAMSVVNRVTMFANSALLGLGQGFQPVCGFNYGAGLYGRVRRAYWFCLRISVAGSLVFAAVGFTFAPQLIAVFRDDPEVVAIGALALRLQCLTFPAMSWIILISMLLQTIGRAIKANIMAVARQGMFLLPTLFILTPLLGLTGVQVSQPVADLCAFAISLPLGIGVLRELKYGGQAAEETNGA